MASDSKGSTTEAMLESLREGWSVTLMSGSDGWCLTLRSERNEGTEHTYRGHDLGRIVRRAWAGEAGDKVGDLVATGLASEMASRLYEVALARGDRKLLGDINTYMNGGKHERADAHERLVARWALESKR